MARAVLIAVRLTESSTFAFDRELMKLDMLPPGQEATNIMPIAMVQLMLSFRQRASRKVNSGSSMHWHSIPSSTDFGLVNTSLKVCGLMPSATPYITNARTILMVFIPPALRLTLMLSIVLAI